MSKDNGGPAFPTPHKDSAKPHKDSGKPHKWSSVIKAWADGKAIEYKGSDGEVWQTYTQTGSFGPWKCMEFYEWRIKPERWYRVAQMGDNSDEWTTTIDAEEEERDLVDFANFKGWLTERIYY
jgi:hypothetical protein